MVGGDAQRGLLLHARRNGAGVDLCSWSGHFDSEYAGLGHQFRRRTLHEHRYVVDNQCYQTVENMPMVNQDGADYTMMARGAGFQRAITIDNLDELDRKMPEIVAAPGPYF